jgi:uncharacterized protein YqeY
MDLKNLARTDLTAAMKAENKDKFSTLQAVKGKFLTGSF